MNTSLTSGGSSEHRPPKPVSERGPQFLLLQDARRGGARKGFAGNRRATAAVQPLSLTGREVWIERRRLGPSVFSSFVLHCAALFFCVQFPFSFFAASLRRDVPEQLPTKVYKLQTIALSDYLPVLSPAAKSEATTTVKPPAPGTTRTDPRLRIISNPPHPDNARQTILQASSPPNLRFPVNLRLPNVILGGNGSPLVPTLQPRPATLRLQNESRRAAVAPVHAPDLALPPSPAAKSLPALPVASLAVPSLAPPPAPEPQSEPSPAGSPLPQTDVLRLAVISVEPGPVVDSIALPPGQRLGKFTISAEATGPGSPGGTVGGTPSGISGGGAPSGAANNGEGANGAAAASPGNHGVGGRGMGDDGLPVSSETPGKAASGPSAAMILDISRHIYPVLAPPHPAYKGIVVTAGPQGGGGLHVFGVLRGGKVYTSYLAMPGKNWILEYSIHDGTTPAASSRSVKVQLDPPLVAPAVQEQFNFHRSAFPKGKPGDMIILRGFIRADGAVDAVSVLKGFDELTDQAALVAFRRWRFTPAMRAGKPVEVEILVGVPGFCPECQ